MVREHHPFLVEAPAEAEPHVERAALVEVDGAAVLACQVREPPAGWQDALRERTGVDRVVQVAQVPLDPRHNAKVDRAALRRVLSRE